MDVFSKDILRVIAIADQWRTGQGDHHRFPVGRYKVCQKGTLGTVTPVSLVQEVDPLHIHIIVRFPDDGLRGKLLDIHHRDGILTCIVGRANRADVLNKFLLGVYFLHMKTTSSKFISCLGQQIQTINDKIELRDFPLPLIVVPKITDIVERQSGFPTPLGMPNNTMLDAGIQLLFNCQRSKKLWVSHNVLLQCLDTILICAFHIGKAVFQEFQKADRQK